MRHLQKTLVTFLMIVANLYAPMALAVPDSSVATLNISGNVPTVFSVTARGYPGDLDLWSSSVVVSRALGIFHFKMNEAPATMTLTAATTLPNNGTANYAFTSFTLAMPGCTGATLAAYDPTTAGSLITAGKSVKPGGAFAPVDEDCPIEASWVNPATLPTAGKYTYNLTMTIVGP